MDCNVNQKEEFADEFDGSVPLREALVMKRFQRDVMRRGEALAEVGGVFTNVPHIVTHHSPTGFEFGYGGSGPADLALNVCQAYLNMQDYRGRKSKCWDGECWTLAWVLHQDFKRDFVAAVPREGATIPFSVLDNWFTLHMTDELVGQCRSFDEGEYGDVLL